MVHLDLSEHQRRGGLSVVFQLLDFGIVCKHLVQVHKTQRFVEIFFKMYFILICRWILAYRDAMSFRFSHYFVSFLSQALVVMAGYSDSMENRRCDSTPWGFLITNPRHIEWPRSLVNVVVVWNMSMHYWLRTCE